MISVVKGTVAGVALAFVFALPAISVSAAELPKDANTTCPVMTKKEVNPDLFVDHEGERIYLCCKKCQVRFAQDPEKYLARMTRPDDSATTSGKAAPSPKK